MRSDYNHYYKTVGTYSLITNEINYFTIPQT